MDNAEDFAILEMRGIKKLFPGVRALDEVDYQLRHGEVHVILGENGAGKSTLMKILAGIYSKDAGEIILHGEQVQINSVTEASELGIEMIHQELDLIGTLTVAQNIYLGRESEFSKFGLIDNKAMTEAGRRAMKRLNINVDPDVEVRKLGVAVQQTVAIVRALERHPKILIMDEPTAAIGENEVQTLFKIIKYLTHSEKISICYISHRLEEISQIGDRVTILRDGRNVKTLEVKQTDKNEMVRLMVGREMEHFFPPHKSYTGDEVLRVEGLNQAGRLKNISFSLRAGEITGLFGLVGAGRTELARAIFGADTITAGRIYLYGKEVKIDSPCKAVKLGVGLLTEDRRRQGLLLKMDLGVNVTLANFEKVLRYGLLDFRKERQAGEKYIQELNIRTPGVSQAVKFLSGGNQQKAVLARWLFTQSKVLIFDEPTRGIDIGAKMEIYNILNELTRKGVAVLMISSEVEEILAMSDRIIVMHDGRITGRLERAEADQELIMHYATGSREAVA